MRKKSSDKSQISYLCKFRLNEKCPQRYVRLWTFYIYCVRRERARVREIDFATQIGSSSSSLKTIVFNKISLLSLIFKKFKILIFPKFFRAFFLD